MISGRGKYILIFSLFSLFSSVYIVSYDIFDAVNRWREDNSLKRLYEENALMKASGKYAELLIKRKLLGHRIEGTPLQRYRIEGGTAVKVGEILGTQSPEGSSERMVEMWIESSEHFRVLSGSEWSCMGWAVEENESARVVVVMFSVSALTKRIEPGLFSVHPREDIYLYFPGEDNSAVKHSGELLDTKPFLTNKSRLLEIYREGEIKSNRIIISPIRLLKN